MTMNNKDFEKLTCYGIKDDDGKNQAWRMDSEDFGAWKRRYQNAFCCTNIEPIKEPLDIRKCYCDPDTTYNENYQHQFFRDLAEFLEKQEQNMIKEENRFNYKFVEDEGIEVCGKDKGGNEITFHLRSDQFGFSAPSNEKKHPYDLYIMKMKSENREEEAVKNVVDWVAATRTIGGSFLWPSDMMKGNIDMDYNKARGGACGGDIKNHIGSQDELEKYIKGKKWTSFYIEDRVDLTLLEVKHWFEWIKDKKDEILEKYGKGKKKDKIFNQNNKEKKEKENIINWFQHFGTFENYIQFFCFDNFVDGQGMPFDIVASKLEGDGENKKFKTKTLEEQTKYKQREAYSIYRLSAGEMEQMFEYVSSLTLARSCRMQEIIDGV